MRYFPIMHTDYFVCKSVLLWENWLENENYNLRIINFSIFKIFPFLEENFIFCISEIHSKYKKGKHKKLSLFNLFGFNCFIPYARNIFRLYRLPNKSALCRIDLFPF